MTRAAWFALASLAVFTAGCHSSRSLPGFVDTSTGGSAAAGASAGGAGAGASANAGGQAGAIASTGGTANGGGAGGSINVVSVTDVGATSCTAQTSAGTLVVDSGPNVPAFDRLGRAGARLYALSRSDRTFFEFGLDGTQPSAFVGDVMAASGDANGVTVAFAAPNRLFLQRYDEWLTPVGASTEVAPATPCGASLAPLGSSLVAAWTEAGQLHARIVDPAGSADQDVSLARADAGASCWTASTEAASGVALSWTVSTTSGSVTLWTLITADGHASTPTEIFATTTPHEVVAMARTTSGFALVINETGASSAFVLVRTDSAGQPAGSAYRFLSTGAADDIAAHGDEVAISGSLADGREVLRIVEPTTLPNDEPSCLDDNRADASFVGHASLFASDAGYAILARHRNGSAWLQERAYPL